MSILTQKESWRQLEDYAQSYFFNSQGALAKIPGSTRTTNYCHATETITLNYNNQQVDDQVLSLLVQLAGECKLHEKIPALLSGALINNTEHRPALHTALRTLGDEEIIVNKRNVIPEILLAKEKMRIFSEKIRAKCWLGFSGQPISDVVNIGIGGSMLGAQFCMSALADFITEDLSFHYISGIDPKEFQRVIRKLNPKTTLFIVASKSFKTKETLSNMNKAIAWINQTKYVHRHFIAVTENIKYAEQLGLEHIIPIWSWIGGRYSLCSAINLITCIAIGYERFSELLFGANEMDKHFLNQEFAYNLPVLMALLGIWNNNFLKIHNLLVLTYPYDLRKFVPYLQQLDMESNGKSIDKDQKTVNYATGPIVWGGAANQIQHSYFQLLYEGTHSIAADLINVPRASDDMVNHLCNGHMRVLADHRKKDTELILPNTPINHLSLIDCTPKTIGSLSALYEHKIFTQSVIWNINAFDQPGVDLSKQIMG